MQTPANLLTLPWVRLFMVLGARPLRTFYGFPMWLRDDSTGFFLHQHVVLDCCTVVWKCIINVLCSGLEHC